MSQLARSIIRLTLLSTPVVFLGSPVFLSALPAQAQQTAVAQERMAIAVVNFKRLALNYKKFRKYMFLHACMWTAC
jgi:hypothetical protein